MITPFEYVIVLISIILGMGLTQIISGIANIIHRWEKVTLYWPHLILVMLVFIIHVQEWFDAYEMRHYEYWRLPTFLFIILYPVNLYILAKMLFPVSWRARNINLKEFYFLKFKRIYLLIISLDILGILYNIFISGYTLSDQILQFSILLLLTLVVLRAQKNELFHKIIAICLLLISIITFTLTWNILLLPGTP